MTTRSICVLLLVVGGALLLSARTCADDDPVSKEAALQVMLTELRAEAARIRGLEWKREVPGVLIAREDVPADLRAYIARVVTEDALDREERLFRRMGLLSPKQDLTDIYVTFFAGMAAGYYDPHEKTLYVVDDVEGDAQRPIILHELIHALEDQYFDFVTRMSPIMFDGDQTFATSCVLEGSAEHARMVYERAHPEISALLDEAMSDPKHLVEMKKVMQSVPAFVLVPMMVNYEHGTRLVSRATVENGRKDYATVMAELYADGPVSAEQVIHLDRWFTTKRDYPRSVAWACDLALATGKEWRVATERRMGELDLALYIDFFLAGNGGRLHPMNLGEDVPAVLKARTAAAGWDGGRLILIEKDGCPSVLIQAWCFDSAKDADEAGDALLEVLDATHGKAWVPSPWKTVAPAPGQPSALRVLSYKGKHGRGRIAIRDDEVLILDGAPEESLERVWTWTLKTRFNKDDRDKWGEPE